MLGYRTNYSVLSKITNCKKMQVRQMQRKCLHYNHQEHILLDKSRKKLLKAPILFEINKNIDQYEEFQKTSANLNLLALSVQPLFIMNH